jgi:hypothetical protein
MTDDGASSRRNVVAWVSAVTGVVAAVIAGLTLYLTNRPKPPPSLGGQIIRPVALVAAGSTGDVITVRATVSLNGLAGKTVLLQWALDNARTGQPATNTTLVGKTGAELTAQAATDTAQAEFNLPPITPTGALWLINLRLIAPNGTVLDQQDTPSFIA